MTAKINVVHQKIITTTLQLLCLITTTTTTTITTTNTTNTTTNTCTCLSHLVYDVIVANNWSPVTFIFDQDEGIFTSRCAIASGLYRRLWWSRRTVTAHPQHNFTLPDHTNTPRSHGYVLAYTNATSAYLDQASSASLLDTTHWFLLLPSSATPSLLAHAKNLDIFINSDFLFATPDTCPESIKVQSAYRVGPRSGVLVEGAGEWGEGKGYRPPTPANRVERRSDFQGYPMRGVGVKVFQFMSLYLGADNITGFVGDIVSTLKNAHNFSLSHNVLEGYAYGKIKEGSKSEWTGMVGSLQSREADLTVSELSITKERQEVVTYTQPIYIISRKLFVATQEDFAKKMLAYTTPMDTALYWCILMNMVGLAGILYFIERLQRVYVPMEEKPVSMSVACWYMLSALLQQGSTTCPISMAARGIYWLGYSVSLIVYTAYSATLVSHLTVEQPAALPFNNLQQLARQSGWDAGCNNNDLFQVTATQTCVDSQTQECRVLRQVWQEVVMRSEDNLVDSYSEGLEKVLSGKYVFIGVDINTHNYIRSMPSVDACRIKELPGRYITGGIAIGLQKHSPFRTVFDHSLQKMRESGLMDKLRRKWMSAGDRACGRKNTVTASLSDVAVIFILLMGGAGFSCLLLGLEHAVKYVSLRWLAKPHTHHWQEESRGVF
ncbi:glutamate receptor-like [Eriocheir sinensis]|uniref:glutamate receptor-like n=1 Tax=Eriocheir sinensis TaxID=95602 RepID=UPI0021C90866|nr:glutamate receptor-like [Eriocheir sinensis]XP_050710443.1 glutamate receptor-like [Eriocheir sinensis]